MKLDIPQLVADQHTFFASGISKPVCQRIKQLKRLKSALLQHEPQILDALHADLHKPSFEGYTSELLLVIKEINYMLKNIHCFATSHRVKTPWFYKPASSYIRSEPHGVVLIIAPWNYPLQLSLLPLIGALAAGNCAIIKPSEHAPHTARIITKIINNIFDPAYIAIVQGGIEETQILLQQKFDYIFFTGSTRVGKIIMQAATEHLTPLTLELGGKCPSIVHKDAQLDCAAKRIAWGKFLNAGQSCVAPDYVLVHNSQKQALIHKIQQYITQFFSNRPEASRDYARIIDERHFDRLTQLLTQGNIIIGGIHNRTDLYIAPTLLDNVSLDDMLMQEEIFGPILPIITYETLDEALEIISDKPSPITTYVFTQNKAIQKKCIKTVHAGSICINDTILQAATSYLPFGGVGMSGFGRYHGKASFDTFSYKKTLFNKSCWFDHNLRYPPYGRLQKFIQKFLSWWNSK